MIRENNPKQVGFKIDRDARRGGPTYPPFPSLIEVVLMSVWLFVHVVCRYIHNFVLVFILDVSKTGFFCETESVLKPVRIGSTKSKPEWDETSSDINQIWMKIFWTYRNWFFLCTSSIYDYAGRYTHRGEGLRAYIVICIGIYMCVYWGIICEYVYA